MKINLVTTNPKKVEAIRIAMKEFNIEVDHIDMDYPEDKEGTMQDLVKKAVKDLAEQLQKPIVIEDTGLYFEAFDNFPGMFPKFIYQSIGFKGIQKLLDGENRGAYFLIVVGYCEPGKDPVLFEGELKGKILPDIFEAREPKFPYDTIFVPEGYDKTMSDISLEERNKFGHRGKAFRKLGEYLKR
ncbi:MAG: non-canonical purine NTP pyrophosphatase [Candidatus Woesearchaeota archaeon]|jgi:non-canonical purine NTP pyrophosphatase (RdgB/HAM1 family)|nr:non-canonical purine NTP pyrophosphatase [Candidatus Woesearchaeota archaeon]